MYPTALVLQVTTNFFSDKKRAPQILLKSSNRHRVVYLPGFCASDSQVYQKLGYKSGKLTGPCVTATIHIIDPQTSPPISTSLLSTQVSCDIRGSPDKRNATARKSSYNISNLLTNRHNFRSVLTIIVA